MTVRRMHLPIQNQNVRIDYMSKPNAVRNSCIGQTVTRFTHASGLVRMIQYTFFFLDHLPPEDPNISMHKSDHNQIPNKHSSVVIIIICLQWITLNRLSTRNMFNDFIECIHIDVTTTMKWCSYSTKRIKEIGFWVLNCTKKQPLSLEYRYSTNGI